MTASQDMIRGRSNVVTMTNNSGGALIAGDVCVQDTSADENITTTTSAASTLKVFVAAESIASGATGKFYESGYCPLVNVNAAATRGYFLFTHTVAKQATSSATYGAGAFGKVLKAGTSPSAIIYSQTAQIGAGVARSGSTTDAHFAVWNGSNADSLKDGGAVTAGLVSTLMFTIDGGGSAITTGVKGDIMIDFGCTINAWTLLADTSGAIKVNVWRDVYANFPPTGADSMTNTHDPEIAASGTTAQQTNLANWTSTTVSAGDIIRFNVESAATVTRVLLAFKVTRT